MVSLDNAGVAFRLCSTKEVDHSQQMAFAFKNAVTLNMCGQTTLGKVVSLCWEGPNCKLTMETLTAFSNAYGIKNGFDIV